MARTIFSLSVGVFFAVIIPFLIPNTPALAATPPSSSDLNIKISEVIALSISSTCDNAAIAGNDISLSLTPNSSGVLSSCPNIVTVSTNTPGFQLSFKSNSPNLVNTTNNSLVIASTTNTTANSLLANSWGYALPASSTTNHDTVGIPASLLTNFDNSYLARSNTTPLPNDKYLKPPTTDTTIKDLTSSLGLTTNLVNNQTTIYYAVTADMTTRAGAYSTTLTYTALGEIVPCQWDGSLSFNDPLCVEPYYLARAVEDNNITTMQEMTGAICQSVTYDGTNKGVNDNNTVTLTDIRNNQDYQVRKLADGNCWMIDNLKLELTNGMVLEPTTTNVTTDTEVWFTQDGTSTGTPLTGMTGNFTTVPGTFLTRSGDYGNSDMNSQAWRQVDPSSTPYCSGTDPDAWNGDKVFDHGSLTGCGYLYNSYTALAGTGTGYGYGTQVADNTTNGSICPANWQIPLVGDFGNLGITYPRSPNSGRRDVIKGQGLWTSDGAFRGVYSGSWMDPGSDSFKDQGVYIQLKTRKIFEIFIVGYEGGSGSGSVYISSIGDMPGYAIRCWSKANF